MVDKKDLIHAIKKGTLSAIPFAGGLAADLYEVFWKSPFEKRFVEELNIFAEKMKRLEEQKGLNLYCTP